MLFDEIKPFVRYARKLEYNDSLIFPQQFPIDARLFYICEGECNVEINGQFHTLVEGTVLYINSGVIYRILPSNVTFLAINFDFTPNFSHLYSPIPPLNTAVALNLKYLEKSSFSDVLCFNEYCIFDNFHSLQKLFSDVLKEYSRKLPFSNRKTSNLTELILIAIARKAEERPTKNGRFEIEEIIKYIQNNFQKEINNQSLSKIYHYHPNYLSSEFKRVTGKSLHQFVLETRIMNSVKLMESGNKNILEIAVLSGFNDSNYFTRYFKATMGITPSKYIKNCIEK